MDCCKSTPQKRSLAEVKEKLSSISVETNSMAYRGMKEWRHRRSKHHAIANNGTFTSTSESNSHKHQSTKEPKLTKDSSKKGEYETTMVQHERGYGTYPSPAQSNFLKTDPAGSSGSIHTHHIYTIKEKTRKTTTSTLSTK